VGDPLFDLSGRVAVVTGGLGQLGAEYVAGLSQRGMRVAVFDEAAGSQSEQGPTRTYPVDVTSRRALAAATGDVIARWGVPHVLVNNAALDSPPDAPPEEVGPFETYPEASFDQVMDVNVKGTLLGCQVVGSEMAKAGRFFKPVAYSVSKSAVLNLTRYLATYWAKAGVRVNTLTLAGVFDDQPREFLDAYERQVPLGRMARAEECVGAIVFLAADASSYMTGANLIVDGGWSAW
jgi:NAD(P)-dependent dehydrogenase (short-subunit alcohol dehydrogenase family)